MTRLAASLCLRIIELVRGTWLDYAALAKPRLVSMVLLSTMVGFYLAARSEVNVVSFVLILVATCFVASGSMALNQYLERVTDAKMIRTQNRPLPSGRLEPREALVFGLGVSLAGFLIFIVIMKWTSVLLAVVAWASYLFIYTPLKGKTSLSTIVGAVPGALPPAIGWTGADGPMGVQVFLLFLIVFFWQMPHFLAIAWMYREDYRRAGQPILSVIDREGTFVARQMIVYMCALMPVSLLPTLFALTGTAYFFGAFVLGLCFAAVIIFAASHLDVRARYVLRASVVYLALLLILMVMDRV
ncbi:MAG: protoheme IX farnesyltransferase [Candidatus Omnitrophica bacterium]|nr:protoheme IX farnesyltransferase [Candidatus Omnitrophota bacterium]